MRFSIFLLVALALLLAGAEAKYSPGLEIASGSGITFSETGEPDAVMDWATVTGFFVYPEMFGAMGDNSTDDSVALQAMIDYAEDNGCVIMLPFKSYAFGTELDIPTGCTIRGVRGFGPWDGGFWGSRLRYTGTGRALNLTATSGYTFQITLEDFILQGNGTSIMNGVGTGIYAKDVSEFQFRDLAVRGFETGIYGDDFTIGDMTGCYVSWNDQGMYLIDAARIVVRDGNIWNNGVGIRLSHGSNIVIENNHFERCTDFIKIDPSFEVTNTIYRVVIRSNNFKSDPDGYSGSDGFAPYWDCHMINITNQDYTGNTLVVSDMIIDSNWASITKTDGLINVNFDGSDGYAYMHFSENTFYGMNTSVVDETGSGAALTTWNQDSISGKQYGSGNVQVAGRSFAWDTTYVLGKIVLNTTASTTEGAIWYDTGANKLKFYNGAAVETVTSST